MINNDQHHFLHDDLIGHSDHLTFTRWRLQLLVPAGLLQPLLVALARHVVNQVLLRREPHLKQEVMRISIISLMSYE